MKNFPKSDGFSQGVGAGKKFSVFNALMGAFLLFNLVIRFCTIFYYPPYNGYIATFFGGLVCCCIFVILFPKYLKAFLFLFGFSFFLFGFASIDIQSRVLELIVTCVATTLFVINWRAGRGGGQMRRAQSAEQGATNNTNGHGLGEKGEDRSRESEDEGEEGEQRKGISREKAQKAQELKKEKDLTTEKIVSHRAHGEHREGRDNAGVNRPLVILILCYVVLSLFSLLLLPLGQIVKDLWFFGFPDSFFYLFIGPPYSFYYPVAAVIRLILFVVFAIQLSICAISPAGPPLNSGPTGNSPDLDPDTAAWDGTSKLGSGGSLDVYKALMAGIFSGAVFCAFVGLFDFYGIISLRWYTMGIKIGFQSTFLNPGWFAEFVLTAVPFVLIGFMSKINGLWWKILLFGALVICEIALILSLARAGWVSYPLILSICWVFYYFSKEGRLESFRLKRKDLLKVAFSVPVTIVISLVLLFQVLGPLSEVRKDVALEKRQQKAVPQQNRYSSIKAEASDIIMPRPGGRFYTWKEGFNVGRESPLFGAGYESFCWHANILAEIQHSFCGMQHLREGKLKPDWIHQTPHSIFFQLFVSGGIVGVYLWVLIIGYAVTVLIFDLVKNKRLLNTPFIVSIISFHMYGIFQSMQYIPMIWLLIFLNLGYAMTINDDVLPIRVKRVFAFFTKISIVLVVISLFVYLNNFKSSSLAEKFDKRIYAMDQDRDRFTGFFQHSKRWRYGDYRWCGKRGRVTMRRAQSGERGAQGEDGKKDGWMNGGPSEMRSAVTDVPQLNRKNRQVERGKNFTGQGAVELEFHCRTPGVEKEPVVLTVFHDGKLIDTISFTKKGSVTKKYELPEIAGKEQTLLLEISRTWIPHEHLGNFDRRKLGIGVRIVKPEG